MPNAPYHADVPLTKNGEPLNQPGWKDLNSESVTYWAYGFITYDDIFACPHKLTYCYFLSKTNWDWVPCKDHNTTDTDKCDH